MPAKYEIRIRGRVSPALVRSLGELEATVEPVETTLSGALEDRAALHSVLERIDALGLELLEVRRLAADGSPAPDSSHPGLS